MAASIFDLKHATALLNDPLSMVKKTTCRKHIILPPCYLDKLKTGIREVLSAETKQYSESFQGVLIAYENVQLIQPFGSFLSDQPFLHFDIQADFIIFQPTIGCTLEGVVNKIGRNHVGFLVHGCFNGMAPRSSVEPDELWLGDQLQIGQGFTFEVTYLDLTSKVLFIRGKILSIRENQIDDNWDTESFGFGVTKEFESPSKLLTNHAANKRKKYFEEELNENIQPTKKQKTASQAQDDNLNNDNHSESLFSSDSVSDVDKSYSNNFNSLTLQLDNSSSAVNQINNQTKILKKLKKTEKKKKTREKRNGTTVKDTISNQTNKTLGKSALSQKSEEKFTLELNSDCAEKDKNEDNFETDQLDSHLIKWQEKKRKLEGNSNTDVGDIGHNYSSNDTGNETRSVSKKQSKEASPINSKVKHKKSREKGHKKKVKDHLRKKNKKKDKKSKKSHSPRVKHEKKQCGVEKRELKKKKDKK